MASSWFCITIDISSITSLHANGLTRPILSIWNAISFALQFSTDGPTWNSVGFADRFDECRPTLECNWFYRPFWRGSAYIGTQLVLQTVFTRVGLHWNAVGFLWYGVMARLGTVMEFTIHCVIWFASSGVYNYIDIRLVLQFKFGFWRTCIIILCKLPTRCYLGAFNLLIKLNPLCILQLFWYFIVKLLNNCYIIRKRN